MLGNPVLKSKREEVSEVFWYPNGGNQDLPDDLQASERQGKGKSPVGGCYTEWVTTKVAIHRPAGKLPFCFSPLFLSPSKTIQRSSLPSSFCLCLAHPFQVAIRGWLHRSCRESCEPSMNRCLDEILSPCSADWLGTCHPFKTSFGNTSTEGILGAVPSFFAHLYICFISMRPFPSSTFPYANNTESYWH